MCQSNLSLLSVCFVILPLKKQNKTAILKKYPEVFKEIVDCIPECIEFVSEPESKCALLWILGEFGTQIPNAPYLF